MKVLNFGFVLVAYLLGVTSASFATNDPVQELVSDLNTRLCKKHSVTLEIACPLSQEGNDKISKDPNYNRVTYSDFAGLKPFQAKFYLDWLEKNVKCLDCKIK